MAEFDLKWKTNKGIQLAKTACIEFDGDMAIVIVMKKKSSPLASFDGGTCQGFSYGTGKALCKEAGERLDDALKGIEKG